MDRYRYRTKVLVGPWRASPDDAAEDAIRAGQAHRETDDVSLRWLVSGRIESTARARDADEVPQGAASGGPDN